MSQHTRFAKEGWLDGQGVEASHVPGGIDLVKQDRGHVSILLHGEAQVQ